MTLAVRITPLLLAACGNVTYATDPPGGAGGQPVNPSGGQAGMPEPPPVVDYPRVAWARGYPGDAKLFDVAVAPDRALYLTGEHTGRLALGRAAVEGEVGTYLGRLSADGEGEWLRSYSNLVPMSVEVDARGNVTLCGDSWGSFDLGLGEITPSAPCPFVGELSADATPLWNEVFETTSFPNGMGGCAIDSKGRLAFGITGGSPFETPHRLAIQLSTVGEIEWELEAVDPVNSYWTSVAVGPADELYFQWLPGYPIDLGDGVPLREGPAVLAAFSSGKDLLWTSPSPMQIVSSMSGSGAGLLVTGYPLGDFQGAHFFSPSGSLLWEWVAPQGVVVSKGVLGSAGEAWVTGIHDEEPWLGSFVANVHPEGETAHIDLGGFIQATALTRVDDTRLLIGGHYTDDTAIGAEPLTGRGLFLALIETGPR
jgi:hypothetical protein